MYKGIIAFFLAISSPAFAENSLHFYFDKWYARDLRIYDWHTSDLYRSMYGADEIVQGAQTGGGIGLVSRKRVNFQLLINTGWTQISPVYRMKDIQLFHVHGGVQYHPLQPWKVLENLEYIEVRLMTGIHWGLTIDTEQFNGLATLNAAGGFSLTKRNFPVVYTQAVFWLAEQPTRRGDILRGWNIRTGIMLTL